MATPGYTNHKCRCPVCCSAAAEYQRRYQAKYRAENHERHLQYAMEYATTHREQIRAREMSARGRELRRRRQLERTARLRAQFVEKVDAMVVYRTAEGICGVCGEPVPQDAFEVDHIVPLVRGGLHGYENVQIAHPRCNREKGTRLVV